MKKNRFSLFRNEVDGSYGRNKMQKRNEEKKTWSGVQKEIGKVVLLGYGDGF